MTPTQAFRSKQFKIAGMACALALTVIGLIRCVPSDQAVVSDEAATERVKEAEAAEEAEALALKVAHGEDVNRKPASEEAKAKPKSKLKVRAAHPAAHSALGQNPGEEPKVVLAPTPHKASVYVVQVGAFRVKENAEKLTAELKAKGFAAHIQSIDHAKNGELHLVRLEPTADKAVAEESVVSLKEKQSLTGQILSVPAGS